MSGFTPQSANAQSLVNEGVQASAIMTHYSSVPPNTTRCWFTFDLNGPDPDTVMHLWDMFLGEEVGWSDDSYGSSGSSACIETDDHSRLIVVFVRAKFASNAGTADLVALEQGGNGLNFIFNDGEFDSTVIDVQNGSEYDHMTAYAPDELRSYANGTFEIKPAANNTVLFNMTNDGHMLAFDFNRGVGSMSRIRGTSETSRILVSSNPWSGNGPGVTNLYSTRWQSSYDADGDGLGRYLEAELGTCDRASQSGCGNDGY